jgi:hypothetical protein
MNPSCNLGRVSSIHTTTIEESLKRFEMTEKCYQEDRGKWDSEFQKNSPEVVEKIANHIFRELLEISTGLLSNSLNGKQVEGFNYIFDIYDEPDLKSIDERHKMSTDVGDFSPINEWKEAIKEIGFKKTDTKYIDSKMEKIASDVKEAVGNYLEKFDSEIIRLHVKVGNNQHYGTNYCIITRIAKDYK